jgi:hypothetical protein
MMRKINMIEPQDPQCVQTSVSGSVILPTDLRIGNFVNADLYGNDKILIESICSLNNDVFNSKTGEIPFHSLKAIPISEELLLKLNAVKLDFKDFPSFNLFGMQINFVNGLWIEYVSRVEITGLHNLQNIFFFRNSEELQISSLTDR